MILIFHATCQTRPPKNCLTLSPDASAYRQVQTRIYQIGDEAQLLQAAVGVLQDSGFLIELSALECGLIVAHRQRDVAEKGKVLSSLVLTLLTGITLPLDGRQFVTATVATNPLNSEQTAVRITFHNMVWSIYGSLKVNETMREPEVYKTFFSKLSKSIFLEAHEI